LTAAGLLTKPEELDLYRGDACGRNALPSTVLVPQTTSQIQQIVRLAHEERLPLTIRGGGTGLRGGAVAKEGGILLSLAGMDHILEISPENMRAVVQPGVSAHRLEEHLKAFGLSYPIDPASWRRSTIGGDVATRAHGLRSARHGSIGSYLLGLEVVVSPGEVIRCGAKTLKCATGYHLVELFAGSRGQLGVITQITLKLLPRPPARETLLAFPKNLRAAIQAAENMEAGGIRPSRLELVDPHAARFGFGEHIPRKHQDHFLLMLELESPQEDLEDQIDRARSCIAEQAGSVIASGSNSSSAETWWRCREGLLDRLMEEDRPTLMTTIRISLSRLLDVSQKASQIRAHGHCRGLFYGHLGEGRWHLLIRRLEGHGAPDEFLPGISRDLQKAVTSSGGLYLSPIPLGWTPQENLIARHDSGQGKLWRSLKNRFDPLDIFSPIE
jgi:glycolate oxidase